MRQLILFASICLTTVGVGCFGNDAETRHEMEADRVHFWGGPSPDQSLGILPMTKEAAALKSQLPTDRPNSSAR